MFHFRKLILILILIFVPAFLAAQSEEAGHLLRINTIYEQGFSKPRDRSRFGGELGFTYSGRNEIHAGFGFEERKFGGNVKLTDFQWMIGHTLAVISNFYLVTDFAQTPGADFLPRFEGSIDPHFTFWLVDFGLLNRIRKYSNVTTYAVRPWARFDFTELLILTGSVDVGLRPDRSAAGTGIVESQWAPFLKTKLHFSGGKSDEGGGVFDKYKSYGGGPVISVMSVVEVGGDYTYYDGKIRNEHSFGFNVRSNF